MSRVSRGEWGGQEHVGPTQEKMEINLEIRNSGREPVLAFLISSFPDLLLC